jgi:hypothetical protein
LAKALVLFCIVFFPIKTIYADETMVYSFEKPADMTTVIQEMKSIASSFRGSFSGNEYGGSFSGFGSNTAITYSVNEKMIVFTIVLIGNVNNTIQQKLSHSFTIDLPRNIPQAIELNLTHRIITSIPCMQARC